MWLLQRRHAMALEDKEITTCSYVWGVWEDRAKLFRAAHHVRTRVKNTNTETNTVTDGKKPQTFEKWSWWNRFLGLIWSNSQCELYICLTYDSSPKSGPWQILLDRLVLCSCTSHTIGTKWLFRKWAVSLLLSQEGKHPLQSEHRLWTADPRQVTVWTTSTASVTT